MNIDQFRIAASRCSSVGALDDLWLTSSPSDRASIREAKLIYFKQRKEILGDDERTGEVLEDLPETY